MSLECSSNVLSSEFQGWNSQNRTVWELRPRGSAEVAQGWPTLLELELSHQPGDSLLLRHQEKLGRNHSWAGQ
jgi:hypothetical protein